MAITNYTELKSAIENWLDRSDLTALVPDFIRLAEEHFDGVLRVRQQESTTTDTMSSSTITLPSDFLAFRNIYIDSDVNYALEYLTPEQQALYDQGDTGLPTGYAIAGSTVTFWPTADADYTVDYTYYQRIPSIETNTTNWLLTAAPGAYLHGALLQAWTYVMDFEKAAAAGQAMAASLQMLQNSDLEDRWSGSTLKIRNF